MLGSLRHHAKAIQNPPQERGIILNSVKSWQGRVYSTGLFQKNKGMQFPSFTAQLEKTVRTIEKLEVLCVSKTNFALSSLAEKPHEQRKI